MLPKSSKRAVAQPTRLVLCTALALALSACGGGGGSPGAVPGGSNATNPANALPKATLSIIDASNVPVTTLVDTQLSTVRVAVVDASGVPVANQIVKFTAADTSMVTFVPISGTALTDSKGIAQISVTANSSGISGATTISASVLVGDKTASASTNIAVLSAVASSKASISVVNASNVPVTTLSGGQTATVKVVLVSSSGAPLANEVVKFTSTGLLSFTPDSGSALTDANGVASIAVKPASNESAGATSITATTVVSGKTTTASANLSVGAAPLVIGTLSFVTQPPASLPAFNTLQLNIPLTSGGQPASSASGLSLSSLCVNDQTATLVLGSLNNGVQTATYTNKGCVRGSDTITAQVGNNLQTISFGVGSANIGAIQFVGSDQPNSSIVLKGSGGLGRAESALLTFRVLDQNNQGLAGIDVDFTASTTTGGLSVTPARGTTDSTGRVTTTVTSGTIPTPVRVFAQATRNGQTISGLSDTLTISTGLPIQKNVSLSADAYNIEGWQIDGVEANLTVRLADQYGNPISNGTAVSFITEGGAVGSSAQGACTTSDGGCSVKLRSQDFRPANGRVTVMAFVQGLENFVDSNGDGQYSCTNFVSSSGSVSGTYRPLTDTCLSGGEPFTDQGDPFLDAGFLGSVVGLEKLGQYSTLDGVYTPANGDLPVPYNHVGYSAVGNAVWGLNYLSRSAEFVFSGSSGYLVRSDCSTGTCIDSTASASDQLKVTTTVGGSCTTVPVTVRIFDLHNNPMAAGTTISVVDADKVTITTLSPSVVPSTNGIGGTLHTFGVKPDISCVPGTFGLKITSPKGTSTVYQFSTN